MDFENTTWGKSVGGCDEEKLKTDNTTTKSNLLIDIDRPSPHKVYRHQEYERVGRLSRNRAKDSKGTRYCLSLEFFRIYISYILGLFFSHGTNKKWGNLVLRQPKKTRREKEAKKAKKGTIAS